MAQSQGALQHGDRAAREVSQRIGGNFASTAALTALSPKFRHDGMVCVVGTQPWIFIAGSTTGASASCLVPDDVTSNSGRWKANTGSTTIEGTTKPVVAGTAAVGAVGTASDAGHVHPPTSIRYLYAGDSAASDTLAERVFARLPAASTVTAIKLSPTGAATANNTTYATIVVGWRDGAGGALQTLATLTTQVSGGGSWVAFTTKDMGAITNAVISAGGVLTVSIAKASTGVQLPSFVIEPVFG